MPVSTSIHNVGEYYSSHYLDHTFERDVKDIIKEWSGRRTPDDKLQGLGEQYFKSKQAELERIQFELGEPNGHVSSWHNALLDALGYADLRSEIVELDGGAGQYQVRGVVKTGGAPYLMVVDGPFALPEAGLPEGHNQPEPLSQEVPTQAELEKSAEFTDYSQLCLRLLTQEDAPRWVLLLAGHLVYLLDQQTFAQGRFLRFDFDDAYARKEKQTFRHIAVLLSRETLCPQSGRLVHDTLEENSHRFAHGVTEKLQFAVREAIETLANEWIRIQRENKKSYTEPLKRQIEVWEQKNPGQTLTPGEYLKHEALVYVYRLLFCFYAEARGAESGILPMNDEVYRLGYSLESLRDLEHAPLSSAALQGTYFHNHLKQLFDIIYKGFSPTAVREQGEQTLQLLEARHAFTVQPLTAGLFDPDSTPLLMNTPLGNEALQKVVRSLSVSESDAGKGIGRVNYADLGINQLGAVYEGLLNYKGMFAEEDLIHVKPATGSFNDTKTQTYFVPKSRKDEFKEDEKEYISGEYQKLRIYDKGTFILHLTGIVRETSASYYTPEVLTKCLISESLEELLKGYKPEDADEILELKMCEPAMGSGAFLNEACEQLAEHYLQLKQEQLQKTISPGRFQDELKRVKHYIATRNVYGVDLNETAVELGALSLWLGCMHRLWETPPPETDANAADNDADDFAPAPLDETFEVPATPWFGLRLRAGNSLIGARRAVWTQAQLLAGHHASSDHQPRQLKPGETRGENEVYHFLVLDPDMVPTSTEKRFREYYKKQSDVAKAWVAQHVKPKWDKTQVATALEVSEAIDEHWLKYSQDRDAALQATACTASVWPLPADDNAALADGPSLEAQEKTKAELEATSGSFQRLKLIMDAWCAFYFWPLLRMNPSEVSASLPSREDWLESCRLVLGGATKETMAFFDLQKLAEAAGKELPDTTEIAAAVKWFGLSGPIVARERFHHWELVFPEVLGPQAHHQGFALMMGNPPWIKIQWYDDAMLNELDPLLGVKGSKSAVYNKERSRLLKSKEDQSSYFTEYSHAEGQVAYLNSHRYYPLLKGVQTNLYKNFLVRTWDLLGEQGVGGLLHPEGVYDDAKGGLLRSQYFPRLKRHYQFVNELSLFADVHHITTYSINIYKAILGSVQFANIVNLYHPKTIEDSKTTQSGVTPGIKNEENKWELRGHPNRLVEIQEAELKLFAQLFSIPVEEYQTTKLPQVHSAELLAVLEKLAGSEKKLGDFSDEYTALEMFHESNSQRDGIIVRQESPSYQPQSADEWILTGPQIFVATPFYNSAYSASTHNNAYDPIDLTTLVQDYLPRSVYKPGPNFENSVPVWRERPVTDFYRVVFREMAAITGQRTLIGSIIPKGPTHPHTSRSFTGENKHVVMMAVITHSIVVDFLLRMKGSGHVHASSVFEMPFCESIMANSRVLRLNCVSKSYAELWRGESPTDLISDSFTTDNPRLQNEFEHPWSKLNPKKWEWLSPLRTDFARRQALIEIDVLVAQGLGLTLEELQTIYRVQFPVLQQYERADEYDMKGRRLPNTSRKDPGGKELREARQLRDEEIEEGKATENDPITIEYFLDNGNKKVEQTYYPPFEKFDREEDYRVAWDVFKERAK